MDFLKGRIRPMYLQLLMASVGSAVVSSVFGMVDAMMVGRYHGPSGTAALAVFNPVWTIVYSLGILSGIGGSVLYANWRGQGKTKEANGCFTASVLMSLMLSALAMGCMAAFGEPLLRFFGADDELLALAMQYLKPIWFAIPCCVFSNVQSAFLRNDGHAGLAMGAVLFGGVFNLFGDIFFVFTLDMGIAGAGLATAAGLYASNLLMLLHYVSRRNTLRLVRPRQIGACMVRIAGNGFATAIADLSMGVISVLFNRQIMKHLGADALAVYGIITQVAAFVQCCAYGAGQAAQPIISQSHGAGQTDRIRTCLRYGLITCAAFGLFWMLASVLAPNVFVQLFMTPTEAVLAIAPEIIRAYGLSFLLLPFNIFATYYFQAVMRPQLSMAVSFGRGVVISGALILLLPLLAGGSSIWYAMLITESLVLLFSLGQMARIQRAR